MKRSLIRVLVAGWILVLLGPGCAGPAVDKEVKGQRPQELRKKPISGLVNPRFETDEAMIAVAELLLSSDPYWVRFGELGWLDDAKLEHKETLTETGPAFARYNVDTLFLTSGLGIPLSESPFEEANRGRLTILREGLIDLPLVNARPIYLEYESGDPHYTEFPRFGDPTQGTVTDAATLRWNPDWFDPTLRPATLGASLVAEVLWARRLLWSPTALASPTEQGGVPLEPGQELPPPAPISDADRTFGVLLAELATHKIHALATRLVYDSATGLLGRVPNGYRPEETGEPYVFLPHGIQESKYLEQEPGIFYEEFEATDTNSHLWDQAMLLWGALEFIEFNDPRGYGGEDPFRESGEFSPQASSTASRQAKALANLIVRNIAGMHFDPDAGSLVSYARAWESGTELRTQDAGLALIAFEKYLSQSWPSEEMKEKVRDIVDAQSRFLLRYQYYDGAFADYIDIESGDAVEPRGFHLETQAYTIRALLIGFRVTGDFHLRRAAWRTYRFLEETLWAPSYKLYRVEDLVAKGQKFNVVTPMRFGSVLGALRDLSLETRDFTVVERLVAYVNGIGRSGLLLSELQATGENYGEEWDFDADGILKPQFAAVPYGLAPVFASQVLVYIASTGDIVPPQ
jgi:hypothetical protein